MNYVEKVLQENGHVFKAAFELHPTLLEIRQWADPIAGNNTVMLVRKEPGSGRRLVSYVTNASLDLIRDRMLMKDGLLRPGTKRPFWMPESEIDKVGTELVWTRERLARLTVPDTGGISGDTIYGWFQQHPLLDAIGRRRSRTAMSFSFNWLLRMKDDDGTLHVKLVEDLDARTQIGLVLYKWDHDIAQLGTMPLEEMRDPDAFELIAERSKLPSLQQQPEPLAEAPDLRDVPAWTQQAFDKTPTCTTCSCSLKTNARGQLGVDVCGECYLKTQPLQKVEVIPRLFARSAKPRPVDRKHDPRPGIDDRGAWATPAWEDDT